MDWTPQASFPDLTGKKALLPRVALDGCLGNGGRLYGASVVPPLAQVRSSRDKTELWQCGGSRRSAEVAS